MDSLPDRVSVLEVTVSNMDKKLDIALAGIGRLTALDQNVTSLVGFISKHGYKFLIFGAGCMSSLGIGNPALWKFIANFR